MNAVHFVFGDDFLNLCHNPFHRLGRCRIQHLLLCHPVRIHPGMKLNAIFMRIINQNLQWVIGQRLSTLADPRAPSRHRRGIDGIII